MAGTIINITCNITHTISDIMPKLLGWSMIATSGSEKRYNISTRVNIEQVAGGLGSSERSLQQAEGDWRWSDEHVHVHEG